MRKVGGTYLNASDRNLACGMAVPVMQACKCRTLEIFRKVGGTYLNASKEKGGWHQLKKMRAFQNQSEMR